MGKSLVKKINLALRSLLLTLTEFGRGASYALRH